MYDCIVTCLTDKNFFKFKKYILNDNLLKLKQLIYILCFVLSLRCWYGMESIFSEKKHKSVFRLASLPSFYNGNILLNFQGWWSIFRGSRHKIQLISKNNAQQLQMQTLKPYSLPYFYLRIFLLLFLPYVSLFFLLNISYSVPAKVL